MDLEVKLERLGYVVTGIATSGEEALAEIRKNPPDLVLMDIQLQGATDGLTTAALIHEQYSIPIVFVTANANEETIARSKHSGSYGFLSKPFRPNELNATIEIALHQNRAVREIAVENENLQEQVYVAFQALGQTREELQALARHLMQAQETERSRIARELHDNLGQQTAALEMQAKLLEQEIPANLRAKTIALRAGLNTLAVSLTEVSHKLHPTVISDLGLADALEALTRDFRAQGLSVRTTLAKVEDVPLEISTSLYRIAQESLSNVLQHARTADARLLLFVNKTEIILRITDNGQGFVVDDGRRWGGLGLISMKERAHLIGGNLQLTTGFNQGTTVLVRVPLRC